MRFKKCFLLLVIFFAGCRSFDNLLTEKYIIPKGYTGLLGIFYNIKSQPPLSTNNEGEQIFRFNKDGVIYTSTSMNTKWVRRKYYWIDEDDKLTEIPYERFGRGFRYGSTGMCNDVYDKDKRRDWELVLVRELSEAEKDTFSLSTLNDASFIGKHCDKTKSL